MDYRKRFVVEPGAKVRLSKIDASYTGKHETHEAALPEIQKHIDRLGKLQYLLYADGDQSMLVVLEALDAAGKDGVIRHVFSGMIRKEHLSLVSKSQSGKRLPTTLSGVRTCARQAMVRL
jgi:polyphosphate kinase 2 (PPK2 family)